MSDQSTTATTSREGSSRFQFIFWAVMVVLTIMLAKNWWADHQAKVEAKEKADAAYAAAHPPAPTEPSTPLEDPNFPRKGAGFLKKGEVIKIWWDPKNTHTDGMQPVTCTLEGHPEISFYDDFSGRSDRKLDNFPPGGYMVTTESEKENYFRWWED